MIYKKWLKEFCTKALFNKNHHVCQLILLIIFNLESNKRYIDVNGENGEMVKQLALPHWNKYESHISILVTLLNYWLSLMDFFQDLISSLILLNLITV